ncbi:MAG: PTS sugar transporter subunit IIA [Magnetococcales bacterium]|nr:PTS sugar transporter subunit IIA [Magnetococcales bacterium]
MHITHLITPSRILPDLQGSQPAEVFAQIGQRFAHDLAFSSEEEIAKLFLQREAISSTATGLGLAFPHARLPGLHTPMAVFARSRHGVALLTPDQEPVHLLMALLSPPEARVYHIKALTTLVRLLRRPTIRLRLMAIHEPELLYHALVTEEDET